MFAFLFALSRKKVARTLAPRGPMPPLGTQRHTCQLGWCSNPLAQALYMEVQALYMEALEAHASHNSNMQHEHIQLEGILILPLYIYMYMYIYIYI